MPTGAQPPAPSSLHRLAPWAWLLLPLACHLGFSWIGFNPTDDGWMLAIARRLVDGQMPYRDFIFVFPALSALLQVPLVLFGGDYVLWLSRLWGWLTIGAVCWIWSGRVSLPGPSIIIRYALYACACLLTAHTFPVMAWHSLDGMLLISLAVTLAGRDTPNGLRAAFFCTGLAALCRQNFAVFPPLLLLAIRNPFKWRAMFWTALPPLGYLAATLLAGCLRDFLHQVLATSGTFTQVALWRFIKTPGFLWAIPTGVAAAALFPASRRLHPKAGAALAIVMLLTATTYAAVSLWRGPYYNHNYAFQLFGFTGGLTLVAAWGGLTAKDHLTLVAGLGLTWVTAISIGYNSPLLMTGVLLCLIWRLVHLLEASANPAALHNLLPATLLFSVLTIGAAFWYARQHFPYRDRPASELHWDVGEVLAGGSGLRTNAITYATMADLKRLTTRFESEHRRYGILTDCSAVWIRSPGSNPLPCEWPQEIALGYDPELFARFFGTMQKLPLDSPIIVQKYLISDYAWRFSPVPPDSNFYFAQNWVRTHYRKVDETQYFEVYLPPAIS